MDGIVKLLSHVGNRDDRVSMEMSSTGLGCKVVVWNPGLVENAVYVAGNRADPVSHV